MNPIISVIIPVYNPGKHLTQCIESIQNQTYKDLQIILIDDGSTDGSGEICDQFAKKDSRIISYHQKNKGVSAARNKGLEFATGDYYHFPDSDDYLELDTYEYLLELIRIHKCDMVNFEYFITYTDHENPHLLDENHYGLVDTKDAHQYIMTGEPFAWNKLFKKELIVSKDDMSKVSFCEDIFRGEDSLFAHQATDRAKTVWFDKRPLYHYVQSEESAVRGKFRRSQLSALKLYEAYKPLYQEKYPELQKIFLPQMAHLLITLYYDMWADMEDYSKEQETVIKTFKEHEKEMFRISRIGKKETMKFRLFSTSPTLFCQFHKKLHGL